MICRWRVYSRIINGRMACPPTETNVYAYSNLAHGSSSSSSSGIQLCRGRTHYVRTAVAARTSGYELMMRSRVAVQWCAEQQNCVIEYSHEIESSCRCPSWEAKVRAAVGSQIYSDAGLVDRWRSRFVAHQSLEQRVVAWQLNTSHRTAQVSSVQINIASRYKANQLKIV